MTGKPTTVVQFNLRSALYVLAGLSVISAIFLPFVRYLDADRQMRLLWLVLTISSAAGLTTALLIYFRVKAERLCSTCLVKAPVSGGKANSGWGLAILMTVLLIFFCITKELRIERASNATSAGRKLFHTVYDYVPLAGFAAAVTLCVLHAWWGTYQAIEICQNGVLIGVRCHLWKSLRQASWNPETGLLSISVGSYSHTYPLLVPLEQRAVLSDLLREKSSRFSASVSV